MSPAATPSVSAANATVRPRNTAPTAPPPSPQRPASLLTPPATATVPLSVGPRPAGFRLDTRPSPGGPQGAANGADTGGAESGRGSDLRQQPGTRALDDQLG